MAKDIVSHMVPTLKILLTIVYTVDLKYLWTLEVSSFIPVSRLIDFFDSCVWENWYVPEGAALHFQGRFLTLNPKDIDSSKLQIK